MSELIVEKEALDRIFELGSKMLPQKAHESGDPFILVPSGMSVMSLAQFCPPNKIVRDVRLDDTDSFCEYVNKFKSPDTLIFASTLTDGVSGVNFSAILDYHSAREFKPNYCRHVATFKTVQTHDWKTWCAADRKGMTQVEFANWLEDNSQV